MKITTADSKANANIRKLSLQEPIDVLDVDGQYYGFSGCHRCVQYCAAPFYF